MMKGRGVVLRVTKENVSIRRIVLRTERRLALVLGFALLIGGSLLAQPKQEVPPFLKPQRTAQAIEVDGKSYRVPNFSLAPVATGGREFVTNTPFGYLAVRDDGNGLKIDLRRYRDVFRVAEFFRSAPNPLLVTEGLGRTPNGPVFDFTKSAPHLAFFCRLEINEKAGGIIPAKFRLGGVQYWQDDLGRRE